jgi:hypothetical protein
MRGRVELHTTASGWTKAGRATDVTMTCSAWA